MKKYYFIPVAILAVTALFSLCVMLLWNWLLPVIFGLPLISFWQSLGLLLLSKLFFGGLGPRGWGRHPHYRGACRGGHQSDIDEGVDNRRRTNLIRERWMDMSEEERSRFMSCHKRTFSGGIDGAIKKTKDENGKGNVNE